MSHKIHSETERRTGMMATWWKGRIMRKKKNKQQEREEEQASRRMGKEALMQVTFPIQHSFNEIMHAALEHHTRFPGKLRKNNKWKTTAKNEKSRKRRRRQGRAPKKPRSKRAHAG